MFAERDIDELEDDEITDVEDDDEPLGVSAGADDALEEDEELGDDDDDEDDVALPDDEEEGEETSLEELLAQRAAPRRGPEEPEEEDILSLTSEPDPAVIEPIVPKVAPVKDQQEFVCNNCHLVKKRSQLADEKRGLCRDCV